MTNLTPWVNYYATKSLALAMSGSVNDCSRTVKTMDLNLSCANRLEMEGDYPHLRYTPNRGSALLPLLAHSH